MSNCIPSTTSRVVSKERASSTVITPDSPTFSIACAISCPISTSPAEIAPTCAISSFDSTFLALFVSSSITFLEASSIPRLINTGFAPEATIFSPSLIKACANTVAVVVPSPATSFDFVATSFTICAPRFSIGSLSSISFAIVTPSFVIIGAPNPLSNTTFLPFGPSVIFTASANVSTPTSSAFLASSLNFIIFPIFYHLLLKFVNFLLQNSFVI